MDISWVINLKEEHKGFLTGFVPRKNEVFRRLPPEFLQGYCHGRSATFQGEVHFGKPTIYGSFN